MKLIATVAFGPVPNSMGDAVRKATARKDEMSNTDERPVVEPAGSGITPGEYWCMRPLKAPALCLIREVCDEDASGNPLPRLAIRFLSSGADTRSRGHKPEVNPSGRAAVGPAL